MLKRVARVVLACRVADSTIQMPSSSSKLTSNLDHIKIWEAARATSAAPGFFDPLVIGPYQTQLVDGGMGANNPVQYAMLAAEQIWPNRAVQCLVSVGSGYPRMRSVPTKIVAFTQYLTSLATETENTAEMFAQQHQHMIVEDEYYRFNVRHGMVDIFTDD
ncbi:hypothetical protein MMC12_008094 [Toensbergia leucococca]|nr:hypothetical protein [Toensbergia leucococca]